MNPAVYAEGLGKYLASMLGINPTIRQLGLLLCQREAACTLYSRTRQHPLPHSHRKPALRSQLKDNFFMKINIPIPNSLPKHKLTTSQDRVPIAGLPFYQKVNNPIRSLPHSSHYRTSCWQQKD
jgi:hypothetical protein